MVSVLSSSAVDRVFELRSAQAKNYTIGICCYSNKHAALMRNNIRMIMCGSEVTCLSTDCCFSKLAL